MLNDKFGIQTRGGCSCAGTYGHYLLNVSPETSNDITSQITVGNCSNKPGWIRLSIHPTLLDSEIHYMMDAIKELAENFKEWSEDYTIDFSKGKIKPKNLTSEIALEKYIDTSFSGKLV